MMTRERRVCNNCGYEVTYCDIWDAHDPAPVTQFVATMLEGKLKGMAATTDNCPKCDKELTLKSTSKVKS